MAAIDIVHIGKALDRADELVELGIVGGGEGADGEILATVDGGAKRIQYAWLEAAQDNTDGIRDPADGEFFGGDWGFGFGLIVDFLIRRGSPG